MANLKSDTTSQDNKKDSLQEAIENYIKKGFGSMNKNDFEVYIFAQLLKNKYNNPEKHNDHFISRDLRIPETKVKRLRYEADLKYNYNRDFKKEFYDILQNRVYKIGDNNTIQFSIKDKSLRLYLEDILEKEYSFADSSFNSDIVKLKASDFIIILSSFEDKDIIIEYIKKSINKSEEYFSEDKKEIAIKGINAIIDDLAIKFGLKNIADFLRKYI